MAMKQQTFASQSSFEKYGPKSRRELFLDEMEVVVPWPELQALVEPHYPKAGNGRRPVGLANHHRLCANFALINLYLHRKHLGGLAA